MEQILPILTVIEAALVKLKELNVAQLEAEGAAVVADVEAVAALGKEVSPELIASVVKAGNDFVVLLNDLHAQLSAAQLKEVFMGKTYDLKKILAAPKIDILTRKMSWGEIVNGIDTFKQVEAKKKADKKAAKIQSRPLI